MHIKIHVKVLTLLVLTSTLQMITYEMTARTNGSLWSNQQH